MFFDYKEMMSYLMGCVNEHAYPNLETWAMKYIAKPRHVFDVDFRMFKDIAVTERNHRNSTYTFKPVEVYAMLVDPRAPHQMILPGGLSTKAKRVGTATNSDKATWLYRIIAPGTTYIGDDPPCSFAYAAAGGTWIDAPDFEIAFTPLDLAQFQEVMVLREAYDYCSSSSYKVTADEALMEAAKNQGIALRNAPPQSTVTQMVNTTSVNGGGFTTSAFGPAGASWSTPGGFSGGTSKVSLHTGPPPPSFTSLKVMDDDAVDDAHPVVPGLTPTRKQVMLRMPEDVRDKIKRIADQDGSSVNELVNTLIRREIIDREGVVAINDEQLMVNYVLPDGDLDRIETVRQTIKAVIAAHGGRSVSIGSRYDKMASSIKPPSVKALNPRGGIAWIQLHDGDPGQTGMKNRIQVNRKPVFNEGGASNGKLEFDGHFLKWHSFPWTCKISNWSMWDEFDGGDMLFSGSFGLSTIAVSVGDTLNITDLSVDMSHLAP